MDVAGKQVNAQMKATDRTLNMFSTMPLIPLPELTRETVKSFVDSEKAMIDTIIERRPAPKTTSRITRIKRHGKRPVHRTKLAVTHATA
jgi:hypothetical protein